MTSLPLFHINAPAYSTLGSLAARASLVLLPGLLGEHVPRRRAPRSARPSSTASARCSRSSCASRRAPTTPTTRSASATRARRPTASTSSRSRRASASRSCAATRCRSRRTRSIWRHGERPYGTLGSARQHPTLGHVNDARAVDDGRVVGPGEIGELELRNPAIMRGYYEMPEETAAVIVDGWLRTGDLVRVNADETYTFLGRKKEVIRRRGENLSPAEVEAGARTPSRRRRGRGDRRAVRPVGGRREGVRGAPRPAARPTSPRVHAFAREHLAAFKVPRYIEVVAELPHTATDRLAKHKLPARAHAGRSGLRGPARAVSADGHDRRRLGAHLDRRRDARRDHRRRPRPPVRDHGPAHAHRARVPARDAARADAAADAACSTRCSCRWPTTGSRRARSRRGSPTPARPRRSRARSRPGCSARAACSSARPATPRSSSSTRCRPTDAPADADDAHARRASPKRAVDARRAAGERVPGLGHPVHKDVDPRTPRLYAIAAEEGLLGPHLRLLEQRRRR